MKSKTILLSLGVLFAGVAVCIAADAQLGTWKLNEAKSTIPAGAVKNTTVVYAAEGDNVKITVDGVDSDGKPAHNEWTGKFDGKDYPIAGDPTADARAYTKVDERTLEFKNKKGGKAVAAGRVSISADGKTRTVTIDATTGTGAKVSSKSVFDKQ